MLEDYEEFISLALRTRSSKKPLGMLEKWKNQWLPPCLASHARKAILVRPVARLTISSQNLRVSWKPVNPQECVWKNLYRNIMRTILQEKGQFTATLQFGTQIYSFASSNENTRSKKQQWIKNGRNLKKISAWDLTKVTNKSEVIDETRTKGAKVHFASLMDICHLKNAE